MKGWDGVDRSPNEMHKGANKVKEGISNINPKDLGYTEVVLKY